MKNANGLLDDSRLRDYARANGEPFQWRTRQLANGTWQAYATLFHISAASGWMHGATEQAALDLAIGLQISTYDYVVLHKPKGLE